jgi:hypothetical protein
VHVEPQDEQHSRVQLYGTVEVRVLMESGVRCTRCTVYAVRQVRCTVYAVRCTVYDVRCTVYAVYAVRYTVCGVRCTVHGVPTVYGVRCTVYAVRCTRVHGVRCTVYAVRCTIRCTVYGVWCAVYGVCTRCTVYARVQLKFVLVSRPLYAVRFRARAVYLFSYGISRAEFSLHVGNRYLK